MGEKCRIQILVAAHAPPKFAPFEKAVSKFW
jgi:hypothetical protein